MIRHVLAAAALLAASPAIAQSQQEELDARYDRALAAGYKALFLCSAIANAERNGVTRTLESVEQWELTGIQAPLDEIIGELPSEVVMGRERPRWLRYVSVKWSDEALPRVAVHRSAKGCSILAPGASEPPVTDGFYMPPVIALPYPTSPDANAVAAATAGFAGEGPRTTAVVITRAGKIVAERYAEGFEPATPQRTWSVAKSIAATLVGAAVYRGQADVNATAGLGESDADPRRAITIDHLLRMASGRYSDTPGNRTDPLYFGGSTVEETAPHWPLVHAPGTVYRYANNDTLAAVRAIKDTFEVNAPPQFFSSVGMYHTVSETDWHGDYVLSSQVWSTARDLAKLGNLYLNDGMYGRTRILPEGWVEYVSSPSGPQPDGPFGYGAGFWLFNKSEGIPPDTFAAMGNRGQYVVIVPSRDVVIVRRGEDPAGTRFDIAAFTRDVLAALED